MLFNIAIKNLFGAKLRTILNVFVTSISFFLVIFVSGMYDGMREHAKIITIETEVAGGTYWHPEYDSMDPRTFEDSHSIIPIHIKKLIGKNKLKIIHPLVMKIGVALFITQEVGLKKNNCTIRPFSVVSPKL